MSLLAAEYRKITRRKLYFVMTLLLVVFTGVAAFVLVFLSDLIPDVEGDIPVLGKPDVYVVGLQQVVTQTWFPVILAVVLLGGELSTSVWATSLTRDARKLSQMLSRFFVYAAATTLAFLIASALWLGFAFLFAPGEGFLPGSDLLAVLWKPAIAAVAWTAVGTGAVSLMRSVGPAIGVGIAIVFAEQLLALWNVWANVSITAATTALFRVDVGGGFGAFVPGGGLELWHQLAILAGWTVVGLGLTWWGLAWRDA
jgi:hypothetical protein